MLSPSKKLLGSRALIQVMGAIFFFLVIPFGIIFGILYRLCGGTHRERDKAV